MFSVLLILIFMGRSLLSRRAFVVFEVVLFRSPSMLFASHNFYADFFKRVRLHDTLLCNCELAVTFQSPHTIHVGSKVQ